MAYVPERYAQHGLDTQRLVTVLDDWTITSQGIALYFPQNRHMPVALRLFVDTVKATTAHLKSPTRAVQARRKA
ncbi:LysR family transcriptional regulator [Klebsiella aerogenes]|nr:LysR family transcriptional regulator [Klebsiella aerogenes]